MRAEEDVTGLLIASARGDADARDALWSAVYNELRRIAHRELWRERGDHTLGTTALVHEAYFKLVQLDRVEWRSRAHFAAIAAQAMRRILINYAVGRRALKRGGGVFPAALDDASSPPASEAVAMADERAEELLALDEALGRLAALSQRQARVNAIERRSRPYALNTTIRGHTSLDAAVAAARDVLVALISMKRRLDLWDSARLFGVLNMALADGYVASFDTKRH